MANDAKASDASSKKGIMPFNIGGTFMKGLTIEAGQVYVLDGAQPQPLSGPVQSHALSCCMRQCPVMRYNADLLRCIMSDRLNVAKFLNMTIVDFKDLTHAVEAFSRGEPMKLVLDPNGMLRQLLQNATNQGNYCFYDVNNTNMQQQQQQGMSYSGKQQPGMGMGTGMGGGMQGITSNGGSRNMDGFTSSSTGREQQQSMGSGRNPNM